MTSKIIQEQPSEQKVSFPLPWSFLLQLEAQSASNAALEVLEEAGATDDDVLAILAKWREVHEDVSALMFLEMNISKIERGESSGMTPEEVLMVAACFVTLCDNDIFEFGLNPDNITFFLLRRFGDAIKRIRRILGASRHYPLMSSIPVPSSADVKKAIKEAISQTSRAAQRLSVESRNANSGRDDAHRVYARMKRSRATQSEIVKALVGRGDARSTVYRWMKRWGRNPNSS